MNLYSYRHSENNYNKFISQTTQTFQTIVYNITQKRKLLFPGIQKNWGLHGYNHAAHYTQSKARAHYCCSSTWSESYSLQMYTGRIAFPG